MPRHWNPEGPNYGSEYERLQHEKTTELLRSLPPQAFTAGAPWPPPKPKRRSLFDWAWARFDR